MKYYVILCAAIYGSLVQASQFSVLEEHVKAYRQSLQAEADMRGGAVVVTVGSDNACDFRLGATKIQDAIDSGASEIRIATDTYNETLIIDDIDVTLIGGFANCTDAENNVSDNDRATVNGIPGEFSALRVLGNTQRNTVNIRNMIFQNGQGDGFLPAGGMTAFAADVALNFSNVWFTSNTGTLGGGIAVLGGDTDIFGSDLVLLSNTAAQGGGVYCSGDNNSIFLLDGDLGIGGIFNNTATAGDGGGVLLENGCRLTTFSGTSGGFFDFRGIAANQATGNGGGVALKSGSQLSLNGSIFCFFGCIGTLDQPVNVNNNTADSDSDNDGNGGGVWATGANTVVNASAIKATGNKAYKGGAFSIEDGAILNSSYPLKECWQLGKCNQISDNEAVLWGGAVHVATNASANIGVSHIENNRAGYGTAGYVNGGTLDVEGSIITGNGDNGADGFLDNYVFRANGPGDANTVLVLDFNTIADNNANIAVVGNIGGTVRIRSSIVHDASSGDVYGFSNPVSDTFDCLIVHENASITASGPSTHVNVDDPEFVDRLGGDFHIDPIASPAVDYCDTLVVASDFKDIDLQDRGWDDPSVNNIVGPYDIGADEAYADLIFKDDFE